MSENRWKVEIITPGRRLLGRRRPTGRGAPGPSTVVVTNLDTGERHPFDGPRARMEAGKFMSRHDAQIEGEVEGPERQGIALDADRTRETAGEDRGISNTFT